MELLKVEKLSVGYEMGDRDRNKINKIDERNNKHSSELRITDYELLRRGDIDLVVKNISFTLCENEILGIAGGSGSGKSTLLSAIIGLLPNNGVVTSGVIQYCGQALTPMKEKSYKGIRGREITMIMQNPSSSLNVTRKIKNQFQDIVGKHNDEKIKEALEMVSLKNVEEVMGKYPFELSGGMKQRIAIAMALVNNPKVILADEITSSLDAITSSEIIDEIKEIQAKSGVSMIVISHTLKDLYKMCDKIGIMYNGELVELEETAEIFNNPNHPYTKKLLEVGR